MNRMVWLSALLLIACLETGCQSTKLPTPKWPDLALFKKKDKDLAPPSEHFDLSESQLAEGSATNRRPTPIPGEAPASEIKSPSELSKPTASLVASNSTSAGSGNSASNSSSGSQPIRKPYEIARSSADTLAQAAGNLATDLDRAASATAEQVSRNANEVVGQFQQQGRDLTAAASNAVSQATNKLEQQANNAFGFPAAAASSAQSAQPTSPNSGGAFAFSQAMPAAQTSSAPPWASNASSSGQVDPLKSLAAEASPAPLAPSNPLALGNGPSNSGTPTNLATGAAMQKQLQPINQQLVNQNLGASPAASTESPPSQFQLPVAQPPTFIANRSASSSAPQASPSSAFVGTNREPETRAPASPAANPSSNKYPSTGFNSFVAAGSNPATAAAPATNANPFPPSPAQAEAKINAAWQTQASPVAPASTPLQPSMNQPVSHTAELPAELRQRSGGYAPGSIGTSSSGETLWR